MKPQEKLAHTWTPLTVEVAAATHRGLVRKNNEDHYLIVEFRRSLKTVDTNLDEALLERSYELGGYGMIVADGMGGMAGGEVASSMALTRLVELVVDTPDWFMSLNPPDHAETVLQRMTERFMNVDEALKGRAQNDRSLLGMGTTLTVAGVLGSDLIVGHIGDSRAYLLRESKLDQITSDHTLAQALIDAGITKPEEPASRSMRHVLTAALGAMGKSVEPEMHRLELAAGDQVLLCTDGLTEMVADSLITSVLREAGSVKRACIDLVDLALAAGGLDNITVIVARFASPTASDQSWNVTASQGINGLRSV
ncbi:MAG TPA: protein phosphatase 2C domain-containing protein [Pyrinomonadaceae bacterium]|nr:protein phosphatase 2C domain-containing protein [Pyrinomonadaceae bacterium]